VTETLYALAVKPLEGQARYVPTEIRLITTAQGRKQAVNNLLMQSGDRRGWFHRLRADYRLPAVRFDEACIHVLSGADGEPLDDIRTHEDNERAADFITELLRGFTGDDDAAVHVSLAGGRKTMGFYLGYALSLFARPQDRLSHVLVSPPYESHPKFYYPTPYDEVIHTHDKPSLSLNTRYAEVSLATIPVVSLRHGLPQALLAGTATFNATVTAARQALGPARLLIDVRTRRASAAGRVFALPPSEFSILAAFAHRARSAAPALEAPVKDAVDRGWSDEFLADLRDACGEWHVPDGTEKALLAGVDGNYFSQHLSRLRRRLERELGPAAHPYLIDDGKTRPRRYKLALAPENIIFGDIPPSECSDPKQR
jgi:CRISPR-associated protein (TIGR02584 family)